MQTSEDTHTREALALLPLPTLDGLTEAQVRGRDCVWCGIVLTAETAIDCGPRRKKHLGTGYDWFPRGCKSCTGVAALRALHDHAPRCEQCVDNPDLCQAGVILRRLIRDGARINQVPAAEAADIRDRIAALVLPCEPCLAATVLHLPDAHSCTGVAAMTEGQPCPCCGKDGL